VEACHVCFLLKKEYRSVFLIEALVLQELVIVVNLEGTSHLVIHKEMLLGKIPSEEDKTEVLGRDCIVHIEDTI
jgi:hypothetical protein